MELSRHALILFIIAFGAVQCFFGYRAFKGVLAVVGFIVAYLLCYETMMALFGHKYAAFFVSLAAGVFCGALINHLYLVGVFLLAALFGGTFALQLYAVSATHPEPAMLFVVAVLFGMAALFFQKLVIILVTAIAGAWAMVGGVAWYVTGALDPSRLDTYAAFFQRGDAAALAVTVLWAVLTVAGALFQYRGRGWRVENADVPRPDRSPV